jgi:hypothetical protein
MRASNTYPDIVSAWQLLFDDNDIETSGLIWLKEFIRVIDSTTRTKAKVCKSTLFDVDGDWKSVIERAKRQGLIVVRNFTRMSDGYRIVFSVTDKGRAVVALLP